MSFADVETCIHTEQPDELPALLMSVEQPHEFPPQSMLMVRADEFPSDDYYSESDAETVVSDSSKGSSASVIDLIPVSFAQ